MKNTKNLLLQALVKSTNLNNIQKELNISKQNLNYYLRQLRKEGYIIKRGYGHYEPTDKVKTRPKDAYPKKDLIRGHAFIWTVSIPKEIKGWDKRIEILNKNNIKYKLIGIQNNTPRILIQDKKVWLNKNTITIYDSSSYYAKNSIESRKYAVYRLLEVIYALETKLGINLNGFHFKPSREHYGQIRNDLAIQYNKEGKKLHIFDDGKEWLWLDDSHSLGELETNDLVNSKRVQDWWNDNKKHNFEVTASFILNSINQVTQNQLMFNNNFESHVEAIKKLGNAVEELTTIVSLLQKENKSI